MHPAVDVRGSAETLWAALVRTAPSAFVEHALRGYAPEMIQTIAEHLAAAITAYHAIMCSECDPMTQCLCRMALMEMSHYEPGRERN